MPEIDPEKTDLGKSVEPTDNFLNFQNDKQREIYRALLELNPTYGMRLGEIYTGIIRTLNDKNHPDRFSQASHSIRELANLIPRFKEGIILPENTKKLEDILNKKNWNSLKSLVGILSTESIPKNVEDLIRGIDTILNRPSASDNIVTQLVNAHPDRSNLPPYLQKGFIKEWGRLHKWFTKTSHYTDIKESTERIIEKEFEKNFLFFEDLLYRAICSVPFFQPLPEIDTILTIANPTAADVATLSRLISHSKQREYFFNLCNNAEWIKPLKESGAFLKPQEPLRENGSIAFIPWPESKYLVRIASEKPQEVYEIIQPLDSENQTVLYDFVECANNSPIDIAVLYVTLIETKKWLHNPYNLLLPDKIASLMEKLADGGKHSEALRLARVLFDVQVAKPTKTSDDENDPFRIIHHDARPYYDEWRYGEIIKDKTKKISETNPVDLFSIFSSILHQAIELEDRGNKEDNFYEYSHIWRPNLRHARNSREDAKNILLDGVVNLIEKYKDDDEILKGFVGVLRNHSFAIFKRIEMLIYTSRSNLFQQEAEDILSNRAIIIAHNLRREYLPLLAMRFIGLSKEAKKKIIEVIKVGPDFKKADHMTDDEVVAISEHWKSLYFSGIKDHLPPDLAEEYGKIVTKRGEPQDDDGEIKMWDGYDKSPVTLEELSSLDVPHTITFLKEYKPSDNQPFAHHTASALGSDFSKVISDDPEKYLVIADQFLKEKVRPIYIYHFLSGLKDALKNSKCFDWNPVINLCHDILINTKEKYLPNPENKNEQDWNSIKQSIGDLLGNVLGGATKCDIPISLKTPVWEMLFTLCNDPDPTREYENEKIDEGSFDASTVAINSIRGEAINAAINYGLWVAKNESPYAEGEVRMPKELEDLLDSHLDINIDSSLAVRSVYGRRIPNLVYLNRPWVEKNKDVIFPSNTEPNYFVSSFESYLSNQIYDDVFNLLKDKYKDAIKFLGVTPKKGYHSIDINERLPQHLMAVYLNDVKHDDLIKYFFLNAPVKAKAEAISFLGRVAISEIAGFEKEKSEFAKTRLLSLWANRIKTLKDTPEAFEELQEFGWWFEKSPFEKRDTILLMLETVECSKGVIDVSYQIVETLENYVTDFPTESVKILNHIAHTEKDYEISYKTDSYKNIIRKAKISGDPDTKRLSDDLINYLGTKGLLDFRELL